MRRILVLMLTASLALAPAAPAQDPGTEPGLSPTPQTTPEPAPDDGGRQEPEGGPAEEPGPAPDRAELPNTGSDSRMLALAGFSLLLVGAGLRLRTIPEW